ncbi:MAG TPA: hypothetical protein VFO69_10090 [Allosphingosinicella sp.]|nr:hypothetical protein [Allosphingosinicella sp.]
MAGEDVNYLEKRAEAELELAQRATHASAVRAHYELATIYLDRIYQDEAPAPEQA